MRPQVGMHMQRAWQQTHNLSHAGHDALVCMVSNKIGVAPIVGADAAVVSEHHAYGGRGAVELANAVKTACHKPTDFRFLYPLSLPIKAKIEVRV